MFPLQRFIFVVLNRFFVGEMRHDGDFMTSFGQGFHHRMEKVKVRKSRMGKQSKDSMAICDGAEKQENCCKLQADTAACHGFNLWVDMENIQSSVNHQRLFLDVRFTIQLKCQAIEV